MSLTDEIYARIDDLDEGIGFSEDDSEIRKFYSGRTVFLTGATGFMGKIVVEKLLRGCPDLKKLYILARPRKQWSVEQRMERYFENVVFDRMKEATPGWRDKVVPVVGDCTSEGLGLSEEVRRIVTEETNIILHMAATVSFDAKISVALRINVLGTKEMLDLARECRNLVVFLHVSTAYSNCHLSETEEKFYPPPIDMEMVYDLIRADETLALNEELTKEILGKWPNSYTFTKAIAENVVKEYGQGLTIGVFRPSIVSPAYEEPLRNWNGSLNGPILAFLASGLGILHIALADPCTLTDMIPVDMCANALLATSWDVATNDHRSEEPPVYHCTTGCDNPVNWGQWPQYGQIWVPEAPTKKAVWYYSLVLTQSYLVYCIMNFLTHVIPAALADLYLLLTGKERLALKTYFKISKYVDVVMYFVHNEWRFDTRRSRALWDKMSETDQHLFFCDVRKFSWDDYTQFLWRGLRVYNLKESIDNLEEDRSRNAKLKVLHYGLLSLLALLSIYFLYKICHLFLW